MALEVMAAFDHLVGVAAVADHAFGQPLQGEQAQGAGAVVDRLVLARHQALAQPVEGARIEGEAHETAPS
jgi:hypothetical protein